MAAPRVLPFVKMEGLGNDYVYLDGFRSALPADLGALARAVSDRHRGIGSDGLIAVLPDPAADARMVMHNADGSRAEMCGNGIRCVAKLVYDHGHASGPALTIATDRGPIALELLFERGQVAGARVAMGRPILERASIPMAGSPGRAVEEPIAVLGRTVSLTAVGMGNPHAVVFVDDLSDPELARLGPALERHPAFPNRVNVSFAEVVDRAHVRQRTFERGAGETQACGTGACAVGVAGVLTGRTDRSIVSRLPGGELAIAWPDDDGPVWRTGPARTVFHGEWPLG